ncbi:MAG: helix-turn-helix domain-containing protein [Patescibacteria group bacterium]
MTNGETNYLKSALKTGLSPKAASVYVVLLEAGTGLAPKNIITRTGLHRQYVYDALRELQDEGLVAALGAGRRIRYQAASPERLSQEAEKKRIDVLDGVQNLMRLYERSPAGVVEVVRGAKAVIESEFALLREAEEGGFLDVVGGAGMNWVRLFEDRLEEYENLRREKRIKLRYIGDVDDVRHNWEESIIENESRIIPNIGHVVNVNIRPDSVNFNIYEPEILVVRVRNAAAVASQRALFEVLWNAARQSN